MIKHNKKRNVGLIYEQVSQRAAEAVVSKEPARARSYARFLAKHYNNSTELSKEFKLFKAIVETSGVDQRVAERILDIARKGASSINEEKLEREKGLLIKEANVMFGKGNLFNTRVEHYRAFATVQSLINEWRSPGTLAPKETAQLECQLVDFMMTPSDQPAPLAEGVSAGEVDALSLKMFQESFTKKYTSVLSESQQDFLKIVSFRPENVPAAVGEIKKIALGLLSERAQNEENYLLREQQEKVRLKIEELDPNSEAAAARGLGLLRLIEELESDDD